VSVEDALAGAFRADGGRITAHLIGLVGWDLAEEAVQEAYAAALVAWRRDGVPARPRAWLTTTARNRAIDRLRRARVEAAKLRALPGPTRPSPSNAWPARTCGVLGTIYLLFHQGYADHRADLRVQAHRLATLTDALIPDEPEATGLLALLLLLDGRSPARVRDGVAVPLDEQDHTLWDRATLDAGHAALRRALGHERVGAYQLQALIAACHTQPRTDWAAVVRLYDRLLTLVPSDTVRLNRAVALAMRDQPDLALLDGIGDHPLLPATRADFHRRLGDTTAAAAEYGKALTRATSDAERAWFLRHLG
jgi:RNA polymerase sigma-70 factor, ECF subfamily